MVTTASRTAHIEKRPGAVLLPAVARHIEETLKEVMRCTRDGIASFHIIIIN